VGLFAFVWIELASPDAASMPMIKTWVFIYFLVLLAGSAVRGDLWLARADPFDVYSAVVSRLSPLRRNLSTGAIVIGNPLDHLPSLPVRPGVAAVASSVLRTAGLIVFITVVALSFSLAARASPALDRATRRSLPGKMAHSLIPIVMGYIFAHYLSYISNAASRRCSP
jgi:hypothetical protein